MPPGELELCNSIKRSYLADSVRFKWEKTMVYAYIQW